MIKLKSKGSDYMYELNIGVCVVGIIFHIFLCIVYFSKKGVDSRENKVYKYMLITHIFILLSAVISDVAYLYMSDYVPPIMTFVFKVFYISTIVWLLLMNYYSFLLKSTYNEKILTILKKYK